MSEGIVRQGDRGIIDVHPDSGTVWFNQGRVVALFWTCRTLIGRLGRPPHPPAVRA